MPRPKQFDPDQALDQAMRLFWERGYEATSIRDLVEKLGINRFSLYESFGDKRRLFLAALERYTENVFARSLAELEGEELGLLAIERYFAGIARWAETPLSHKGCLLVNMTAEQAGHDGTVLDHVTRQCERVERAFLSALNRAEERGEIRSGLSLRDRARMLALLAQGSFLSMKALRGGEWVASAAQVALSDLRAR
jgi:TetR/AcrR family transcriptional repressor of nem operon